MGSKDSGEKPSISDDRKSITSLCEMFFRPVIDRLTSSMNSASNISSGMLTSVFIMGKYWRMATLLRA